MVIPIKTTDRLVLRPFATPDCTALHRILNEPDLLRYFPSPKPPSLQAVERFIQAQLNHWHEHGFGWWAVELRDTRALIGWNGLQYLPETDEIEVGFLLGRAYWGMGNATEGARASLHYAFRELGLAEIVGIVHPENLASQRVLEKLGMERTALTEYFGMSVYRYAIATTAFAQSDEPTPADGC